MPTLEAVHDTIRSRFEAQVETPQSLPTQYDAHEKAPTDSGKWARLTVRTGENRPVELSSGASGTVTERLVGVMIVQIFTAPGEGDEEAHQLVNAVQVAFRQVTVSSVKWLTPVPESVGLRGRWFQYNVNCPFTVDTPGV